MVPGGPALCSLCSGFLGTKASLALSKYGNRPRTLGFGGAPGQKPLRMVQSVQAWAFQSAGIMITTALTITIADIYCLECDRHCSKLILCIN